MQPAPPYTDYDDFSYGVGVKVKGPPGRRFSPGELQSEGIERVLQIGNGRSWNHPH